MSLKYNPYSTFGAELKVCLRRTLLAVCNADTVWYIILFLNEELLRTRVPVGRGGYSYEESLETQMKICHGRFDKGYNAVWCNIK